MRWNAVNVLMGLFVAVVFGVAGCGGGGGENEALVNATPLANIAPVANAGIAHNVVTGALVTLDGSASTDENGDLLTYSWAFISKPVGSSVAMSSETVAKPNFTADVDGVYILSLVVNDGTVNSAASTVTVAATTSSPALTSIAITPANASVAYGLTQQFFAVGTYTDGSSAILPSEVTWSSKDVCSLDDLNAYTPIAVNSILLGNLSPLSPTEKLTEAHEQFTYISSRAKLGDANAIAKLQDISTILLTLSRDYNASGAAFFYDLSAVQDALLETASLELRDMAAATTNACGLASLRAFRVRLLFSDSSLAPQTKYIMSKGAFNDFSDRAKRGNTEANWQLNDVATTFLTASNSWYGGGSGYVTDFNAVQLVLSEIHSIVLPVAPATISSNNGLATGVAMGTSIITATSGGISGTTTLKISY